MDTPERNQIGTPLSKFEESPVFSYISSLSPIKPVKSLHVTQTFNSLSFSSPLSVFTSPHANSVRGSRFLRSHKIADLSNPKVVSEDDNKVSAADDDIDETNKYIGSKEDKDNTYKEVLIGDVSIELPKEDTEFPIELPKELKYDSGSPDCEQTPFSGYENSSLLQLPSKSASLAASFPEAENGPSEEEVQVVDISDICCIEPKAEGAESNWESLIAEASDLSIFNSPNDTETFKALMHGPLDPATRFCTIISQLSPDDINGRKLQVTDLITSSECRTDCHSSHPEAACEQIEVQSLRTRDYPSVAIMDANGNGQTDNESVFIMHHGLQRRCLDFEMTGGKKKMAGDGSSSDSCISPSDEQTTTNDMQIVASKRNADSQRCILPGIGLHLNSLAMLKNRDNNHRSIQISCSTLQLQATSQHLLSILTASEGDMDADENETHPEEDGSQPSAYTLAEDVSQNSPKKKRSKLEPGGDSEGCKRCNCKKSKCLKLYCECFAAGVYCIEPCTCQDCFNKPIHEDTVLATRKQIESRNPLAFAPKVIRSSNSVPEIGDESNKTPASARHKRGCNCKKSNCLKKYCECYQGGVGCSVNCRCEGCKNGFGRKDGCIPIGAEAGPEETETCENSIVEKGLKKMEIQNNEEHLDNSLTATPLRSLVPLSFSSNGKPPRSFVTRGLYARNPLGKPHINISQQKLDEHLEALPDDEMPEILRGDGSPVTKTSPNGKRVSSPNCNFEGSPTRRTGRRLILQSIPSFPSLTPRH